MLLSPLPRVLCRSACVSVCLSLTRARSLAFSRSHGDGDVLSSRPTYRTLRGGIPKTKKLKYLKGQVAALSKALTEEALKSRKEGDRTRQEVRQTTSNSLTQEFRAVSGKRRRV